MKKVIVISSVIAAVWIGIALVQADMYLASLPFIGYLGFVVFANCIPKKKRPRTAKRSHEKKVHTEFLDFNSNSKSITSQYRKVRTANGTILTVMHFEEEGIR